MIERNMKKSRPFATFSMEFQLPTFAPDPGCATVVPSPSDRTYFEPSDLNVQLWLLTTHEQSTTLKALMGLRNFHSSFNHSSGVSCTVC